MGKLVLLSSLLLYWPAIFAQTISSEKIKAADLPKTIKFRGKFVEAWKWNDKLGENLLLLLLLILPGTRMKMSKRSGYLLTSIAKKIQDTRFCGS